jgi:serine/threonine-protein kinase
VPVYDVGQLPDSRPFFAMRLVKGRTLAQLLAQRRDPAQDLPRFLKVFERVCQTLAYAHAQGVIHRDLKPANVMVGAFGVVQVMDWGLAKVLTGGPDARPGAGTTAEGGVPPGEGGETAGPSANTRSGSVLGTPAYMAPEQARGEVDRLDERADVFGLGAILCAILTGRPPYTAGDDRRAHLQACQADLADALARLDASGAEAALVDLAKRCLAADPEGRPRDAGELAQAFTAYLESDLRRAERDLVRFFELSLDLFCIAGLDGFFRRVNANFSRVLGYTDRELVSRPFLDFVHPRDREKTAAEMAKLSRGLPVVKFENRYRDVAGGYRVFEWTAKSIPEEGLIFAVARDVTDRAIPENDLGERPWPFSPPPKDPGPGGRDKAGGLPAPQRKPARRKPPRPRGG